MISIVIEGVSALIDQVYFGVVDNSENADWVSIESVVEETNTDVIETIEKIRGIYNGTGQRKVKISFDNMKGCPKKVQQSLLAGSKSPP